MCDIIFYEHMSCDLKCVKTASVYLQEVPQALKKRSIENLRRRPETMHDASRVGAICRDKWDEEEGGGEVLYRGTKDVDG